MHPPSKLIGVDSAAWQKATPQDSGEVDIEETEISLIQESPQLRNNTIRSGTPQKEIVTSSNLFLKS